MDSINKKSGPNSNATLNQQESIKIYENLKRNQTMSITETATQNVITENNTNNDLNADSSLTQNEVFS